MRPPPLFPFPFPLSLAPRLRALARVRACVRVLDGWVGGGGRRRCHCGVVVVVVGFVHARVLARVCVRVCFACCVRLSLSLSLFFPSLLSPSLIYSRVAEQTVEAKVF